MEESEGMWGRGRGDSSNVVVFFVKDHLGKDGLVVHVASGAGCEHSSPSVFEEATFVTNDERFFQWFISYLY